MTAPLRIMDSFSQPERFVWHNGAFTVMIPNGTRTAFHPRSSMAELKSLLFRDLRLTRTGNISKYQPLPPESKAYDFYLAQLVHYGLDFYFDIGAAKNMLEVQMRLGRLKVPPKLQALERELKKVNSKDMKNIQDVKPVRKSSQAGETNINQPTESDSSEESEESDGQIEARDKQDSDSESEETSEESSGDESGLESEDISEQKPSQRSNMKARHKQSVVESSAGPASSEEGDSSSDESQSIQEHSTEDESDESECGSSSASNHSTPIKHREKRKRDRSHNPISSPENSLADTSDMLQIQRELEADRSPTEPDKKSHKRIKTRRASPEDFEANQDRVYARIHTPSTSFIDQNGIEDSSTIYGSEHHDQKPRRASFFDDLTHNTPSWAAPVPSSPNPNTTEETPSKSVKFNKYTAEYQHQSPPAQATDQKLYPSTHDRRNRMMKQAPQISSATPENPQPQSHPRRSILKNKSGTSADTISIENTGNDPRRRSEKRHKKSRRHGESRHTVSDMAIDGAAGEVKTETTGETETQGEK